MLEELGAHIVQHNYKADELIIHKGDKGDSFFIIASGSVKVHDEEQVIATLNGGNFFGEISLLDSAPRSMSVTAIGPADLYAISAEDFYRVFRNQPEVTQIIISTITKRLRSQNETTIQQLRSREAELSKLVDERTKQLSLKNDELSNTLDELKAMQQQLIQQEKLASLGQLTAGIAHEIQNPLNFVTNFSKLSIELMDEMAASSSDEEKAAIANDLKQNLERINHHGMRADKIVKGMLQHSRSSLGEKQETDINQLCDEYINLAYHGMRATRRDFNYILNTEYAKGLPKVNVVPQDISRVLLNLFNNAFYAVDEKQKAKNKNGEDDFKPSVLLRTESHNGTVSITVRDNGSGIRKEIKEKIFEPFFTTKPTGQGTGLGLSLSYDILQAHGGDIKVNSEIGEYSEFIVTLPLS